MKPLVTMLPIVALLILGGCHQPTSQNAPASAKATTTRNRWLVTVGGKPGYIDRAGKLVINPQWDRAYEFSEGLAVVCVGQCDDEHWQGYRFTKGLETEPVERTFKYGYIDENGKMVINPMFEEAESFSEGVAGDHTGQTDRTELSQQRSNCLVCPKWPTSMLLNH